MSWKRNGVESYAHKFAKELLVKWLRKGTLDRIVYTDGDNWINYTICKQGYNCFFAVEYPLYYTSNGSLELAYYNGDNCPVGCNVNWCYHQCNYKVEMNYEFVNNKPVLIADIAEGHGGRIVTVIEITHTNPCYPKKEKTILKNNLNFIEIQAMEILKQINEPEKLYATSIKYTWE